MGRRVENPLNVIASVRLSELEADDFTRLAGIFGGRSEALRQGLKLLAQTAGIDFGRGDFGSDAP